MRTIHKATLQVGDRQRIDLAASAKILCLQMQQHQPRLWFITDPEEPVAPRTFYVFGTGHPLPDSILELTYVGTFQLDNGALVFHVFEEK